MANEGRFHFLRGEVVAKIESVTDADCMEKMIDRLGLEWADLLAAINAREYAMGIVTVDDKLLKLTG